MRYSTVSMPVRKLVQTAMLLEEHRRRQAKRRVLLWLLLFRMRLSIRERSYLTSQALVAAHASPWQVLDKHGSDLNFQSIVALSRNAFDDLARAFARHYVVLSGPGRSGRPTRLVDKRSALALLLHYYASSSEIKTLCEVFGSPPSTTERTLQKAADALEQ